jgi:hypothetical membrane protein
MKKNTLLLLSALMAAGIYMAANGKHSPHYFAAIFLLLTFASLLTYSIVKP